MNAMDNAWRECERRIRIFHAVEAEKKLIELREAGRGEDEIECVRECCQREVERFLKEQKPFLLVQLKDIVEGTERSTERH